MLDGLRGACATVLTICGLLLVTECHGPERDRSTGQRIVAADNEPQNWLTTGRNYQETRHSPLNQINRGNVGKLGLAWAYDLDTRRGQESTPLVVDGVVYTTSAWSKVQALDGVSGQLLWQFDPKVAPGVAVKGCCDSVNRGAAYWNGKIYVGAYDGRLIALDAKTGAQAWSTQTVDPAERLTITGAPRVVKGKVIIGNAGGEYGTRGYVSAYDAETGKLAWRFYIVPGDPAKPDHAASDQALAKARSTWPSDSWKDGGRGGGNPWDAIAYDPDLDLLYVGTANAAFQPSGLRTKHPDQIGGDGLFTASVLALRPETGAYVWHYQETPGDQWDYDSTNQMILADLTIDGQRRKVLLHAPKNGFFYVLDRATGKLISARPYGKVNWAKGIDIATGRPIPAPEADYSKSGGVWLGYPGASGAHNWQPMAFDPKRAVVYIPVLEMAAPFKMDRKFKPLPEGFNVGLDFDDIQPVSDPKALEAVRATMKGWLVAWDPVNQKELWRTEHTEHWNGGVLSTDGGLVFQGELGGLFNAYDSATGARLWSFDAQTAVLAAPVTWAKNSVQYVTVVAGYGGGPALAGGAPSWSKDGPRPNISRVLTFAFGKTKTLPAPPPTTIRKPVKAAQFADASTIQLGHSRYLRTCVACHGFDAVSGGLVPDLRYSYAITDKGAFKAIVLDGVDKDRGMVSFARNFSPAEVEAIRAYLIDRASVAPAIGRKP